MKILRNYLFNTEKIKYVKGKKPDVDCILCAIAAKSGDVELLEIYRSDNFLVSSNLYPYNPGHMMIFPIRHIEDFSELTDDEALEMHHLTVKAMSILKEEYNPAGFNIGFNIGDGSGASIAHIHQHVVPRYNNEAGFIDVIAGTRLFVVDPTRIMERLKKRWERQ